MGLSEHDNSTLKRLLGFEHRSVARKLGFIHGDDEPMPEELVFKAVGLLDRLSRLGDDYSSRVLVTVSAILWSHRSTEWEGVLEFLVLVLSRAGFSPSAYMVSGDETGVAGQLGPLSSHIDELSVVLYQKESEVMVGGETFLVTRFQKLLWKRMSEVKLLGVSAPTSAGKSFLLLLKVTETLLAGSKCVIFIVPTLSLVSQVAQDMNRLIKRFQLTKTRIMTSFSSKEDSQHKVYVLTQEKAISAFSQVEVPFGQVGLLIVEEIQNLERTSESQDDQRSRTLFDLLVEFRHACNPDLTVISGPRVRGLHEIGVEVFGETSVLEEGTKDSPVASMTYSISKVDGQYYFGQFSSVLDYAVKIEIEDPSRIYGQGRASYTDPFHIYLSDFLQRLGRDSKNIVFSPTSTQARKTALKLSELGPKRDVSEQEVSLVAYLSETVHPNYDVSKCINGGFAYHHGKMPMHVRAVIEHAVKERIIPNIVCTTTLMQGVNLPTQNVILRTPFLAVKNQNGGKPRLSDYEIANLRGRAGRLLKDFIGRTFVLEEEAFERADAQSELFQEVEKVLTAGYGERYRRNAVEVQRGLITNVAPSEANADYSFLLTYIRQTALRFRERAQERLQTVGIELPDATMVGLIQDLARLAVPKEICSINRYWDPLDLDRLYRTRAQFVVPSSVFQSGVELVLQGVLERMMTSFPHYYFRYLGQGKFSPQSLAISAKDWLREKPLREMLSTSYYDTSERIEEHISLLQNKVAFGLPMLLKPLYDILHPGSSFLNSIEAGAFHPVTRKLVEMSIPRETAIYIHNHYFSNWDQNEEADTNRIVERLKVVAPQIDYWRRVQLSGVV